MSIKLKIDKHKLTFSKGKGTLTIPIKMGGFNKTKNKQISFKEWVKKHESNG